MEKRWCGSSAHVRDGVFKSILFLGMLLSWHFAGPGGAWADDASQVSAAEYLTLPAYDLRPKNQTGLRVGDEVEFEVLGLSEYSTQEGLSLNEPTGVESNAQDSGWILRGNGLSAGVLKPGRVTLPSVILKDTHGQVIGRTNPVTVDVKSSIMADDPKPGDPAQIRPPVKLEIPIWIWIASGVLVILALGALIYGLMRWSRSRKSYHTPIPAGPPKPEDEVALLALDELQRQNLLLEGKHKTHYFRVSEILKRYLGGRYQLDALESTSHELIRMLEDEKRVSDSLIDQIESLFGKLDQVKFTDHVPSVDEGRVVIEQGRELVKKTRRPPAIISSENHQGKMNPNAT